MEIYFTASLSGKKLYQKNYELIAEGINKLGYKLLTRNVIYRDPEEVLKESEAEASNYYKQMLAWIKKADIVVAEVSYPSTGVGHEISLALFEEKPVIAFHVPGKAPYLLESMQMDKLQVIEYQKDNVHRMLTQALDTARENMDVRFNFFIPPRIVYYLDWISQKKKMPRAVYLRRLIEMDMLKNKEFHKED